MPPVIQERVDSRRSNSGLNPWAEIRYRIFDAADDVAARALVASTAPEYYDLFGNGSILVKRTDVEVEPNPDTTTQFEGLARYGLINVDVPEYGFDFSVQSQHITHSLQTINRYGPPGRAAPNQFGALNVTANGPEGADVDVPLGQFHETHYLPSALITGAYKTTLSRMPGRVNNALFRGLSAGECKFLGVTGTSRLDGVYALTFRFAVQPNISGQQIGDIVGIAKAGHDYLWVLYEEVEDTVANTIAQKPRAVYVERNNIWDNFALLGIGT